MGFRFAPTSLFPNISILKILEFEFDLTYVLKIPFDYNNWSYVEFLWRYEHLSNKLEEQKNNTTSLNNVFNRN